MHDTGRVRGNALGRGEQRQRAGICAAIRTVWGGAACVDPRAGQTHPGGSDLRQVHRHRAGHAVCPGEKLGDEAAGGGIARLDPAAPDDSPRRQPAPSPTLALGRYWVTADTKADVANRR